MHYVWPLILKYHSHSPVQHLNRGNCPNKLLSNTSLHPMMRWLQHSPWKQIEKGNSLLFLTTRERNVRILCTTNSWKRNVFFNMKKINWEMVTSVQDQNWQEKMRRHRRKDELFSSETPSHYFLHGSWTENWTGQLRIISTGTPHEIMGNFWLPCQVTFKGRRDIGHS